MELHPILDVSDEPLLNLWYVISCADPPCPRVGQACVFNEGNHSLYIIGGADPSTTYNDVYRLSLLNQQWTKLSLKDFNGRYEHCALLSSHKIYVFGGANKEESLNSVQLIDTTENICSVVECTGIVPCPRTMHSAASDGNRLYVWGGGLQGANPVADLQLHVFDLSSHTWTQPVVNGKLPSARHGHVMAIVDKNLFIHGGMAGATFHKDMHIINLTKLSKSKQKGCIPSGRAAHAACVHAKSIYIFGGVSTEGALDDMLHFNTANHTWDKITFESPPPAPRLDHSMVIAHLPCGKKQESTSSSSGKSEESETSEHIKDNSVNVPGPNIIPVDLWGSSGDDKAVIETADSVKSLSLTASDTESRNLIPVCIVFGGMDESGNIFNDVLLYRLGAKNEN